MIVEAVHPETGEKFSVDIPSLHPEDLVVCLRNIQLKKS